MDVEDAQSEVSASSVSLNSTYSQQNEVLSPEDLAWVDSCLITDSNLSESDWTPLKNALLEIISSQPLPFSTDREDNDFLPSSIYMELNQESSTYDVENSSEPSSTYNVDSLSVPVERSTDENPYSEKTVTWPSLTFQGYPFLPTYNEDLKENDFQGNPFLPTYNEDLKENGTVNLGLNLDSCAYDVGHATGSIFKIWDLDLPSEEGELVKQLDKALSENPFKMLPSSSFDDSGKLKDLKEDSLDDLVAGIADLSLNSEV